jgi:hypothetical protein
VPDSETVATDLTCAESARRPLPGERWSLRFADLGQVAVFCIECDQREFRDDTEYLRARPSGRNGAVSTAALTTPHGLCV